MEWYKNQKNDYEKSRSKAKLKWPWEKCAHAVGRVVKITGGGGKIIQYHYKTFDFRGARYTLDDYVMLTPSEENKKPYVGIIKDIYIKRKEGFVKIKVQWFYRPEDVDNFGNWKSIDSRDLFYSFHYDEESAESVENGCDVDYVPTNKKIPDRSMFEEFIVQNVYDFINKKVEKFDSDNLYPHQKNEIALLVAKTVLLVGHLPDIMEGEEDLEVERV